MRIVQLFFMVLLLTGLQGMTTISIGETQDVPKAVPQITDAENAYAGSSLLNIPLVWKPTETISALDAIDLTAFQKATFTIKPFNDLRKRPSEIGKNVETKSFGKIRYVTTRDNVAAWLTDRFGKILSEFDIAVVKDGGTLSLEADVVKFYVTEESAYKADIGLKVRIRSKTGDVLWEGMTAVSSNRWGRSYNADNYNEALSNACIDVIYALLKNDSFLQAVKTKN
ncbi:MAG: hypothetical protein M0R70_05125 [Nitrospirae bacterium]|nr:hypothetical protein [Nitrospirota bacterium]